MKTTLPAPTNTIFFMWLLPPRWAGPRCPPGGAGGEGAAGHGHGHGLFERQAAQERGEQAGVEAVARADGVHDGGGGGGHLGGLSVGEGERAERAALDDGQRAEGGQLPYGPIQLSAPGSALGSALDCAPGCAPDSARDRARDGGGDGEGFGFVREQDVGDGQDLGEARPPSRRVVVGVERGGRPGRPGQPEQPGEPGGEPRLEEVRRHVDVRGPLQQPARHVAGAEPVEAAGGGEDGPVVAVHEHHGHGGGHVGVDDAGGDVDAAGAQGVQDEGSGGVVPHPADERGAQAEPGGAVRGDRTGAAEHQAGGGDELFPLAELGMARRAGDDHVRVGVADDKQVEGRSGHHGTVSGVVKACQALRFFSKVLTRLRK
ncbi:hypothetical protein GCM10020001_095110 [Nonomuraea salmonea]